MVVIIANQSTTVIEIDALTSPSTFVLLSSISYTGEVITVYETTGLKSIRQTPIYISSGGQIIPKFSGLVDTLIDQPNGFITFQTLYPTTFQILNSFPFRDEYISAGLLNLTASTIYTSILSSIYDRTDTSLVENLFVTSSFFQSTGLTLETGFSSFGLLTVTSTLTIYNNTSITSRLSTLGNVLFNSSLQVYGDSFFSTSLQTNLHANISSSVYSLQTLSTSLLTVKGNLNASTLDIRNSSIASIDSGSDLIFISSLTTVANAFVHRSFSTHSIVANSMSTFDSFFVGDSAFVTGSLTTSGNLVLKGLMHVGGNVVGISSLSTGSDVFINSSLTVKSGIVVSNVSTSYVSTNYFHVYGNYSNSSTVTNTFSSLSTLGFSTIDVGFSTIVRGYVSTLQDFYVHDDLFVTSNVVTFLNTNIIDNISVGTYAVFDGNMSTFSTMYTQNDLHFYSSLTVGSSYINLSTTSTLVDRLHTSNLYVKYSTFVSSFVLPVNIATNSFITDMIKTRSSFNTSTLIISTIYASSVALGYNSLAITQFDLNGSLTTYELSSFYVSSLLYTIPSTQSLGLYITSSLGVGINATDGLTVNTLAYLGKITYADTTVSTNSIGSPIVSGTHRGDGFNLQNIQFPSSFLATAITNSNLSSQYIYASDVYTSTSFVYHKFISYSTTIVQDISIFGNAITSDSYFSTNSIFALPNKTVDVNNTLFVSPGAVSVNYSSPYQNYTLFVNGTMKVRQLINTEYVLPIGNLTTQNLIASTIHVIGPIPTTLSSGYLASSNFTLLAEGTVQSNFSVNTIQTSLSTLILNNTLFLTSTNVGVNNAKPNFTLDVNNTIRNQSTTSVSSIFIDSQLQLEKSTFSLFVATGIPDFVNGISNIRYSHDGNKWQQATINTNMSNIFHVAYNGDLWVSVGNQLLTSHDGVIWDSSPSSNTFYPFAGRRVAWNGSMWVAVGSSLYKSGTIMWSTDGYFWSLVTKGGFDKEPGIVVGTGVKGGRGIAWNGYLWVAVGFSSSSNATIQYSGDGQNWSNASLGGFSGGGNDIIWDGNKWIAGGNNGPGNSFLNSLDGRKWYSSGGGFTTACYSLVYNGYVYVATGEDSNVNGKLQYSYDATNWQITQNQTFLIKGYNVIWSGNAFYASGDTGTRTSFDGIYWTTVQNIQQCFMIGGVDATGSSFTIKYSADNGLSWKDTFNGFLFMCYGLSYGGSYWLSAGVNGDSNSIKYTQDGFLWSNANGGFNLAARAIMYGSKPVGFDRVPFWVATGENGDSNSIKYSYDAINWSDGNSGMFIYGGNDVGFNEGYGGDERWVAVGYNGDSNTIKYSVDGSNWLDCTNTFAEYGYGVMWGLMPDTNPDNLGNLINFWVATGDGPGGTTIKWSENGINWCNALSGAFPFFASGIAFNHSTDAPVWVATGDNNLGNAVNIKYSGDGKNWSNARTGGFFVGHGGGIGVYYNGVNAWIATGDGSRGSDTIQYSPDGSNWFPSPSNTFFNAGLTAASGPINIIDNYYDFFGISYNSNQSPILNISTTKNISIYENPIQAVTFQKPTNQILLNNSSIAINNSLFMNFSTGNIVLPYHDATLEYYQNNVLSVNGSAYISSFVSTNSFSPGALYLGMQSA